MQFKPGWPWWSSSLESQSHDVLDMFKVDGSKHRPSENVFLSLEAVSRAIAHSIFRVAQPGFSEFSDQAVDT